MQQEIDFIMKSEALYVSQCHMAPPVIKTSVYAQARHIGLSNPLTSSKLLNSYDKTSLSDYRIWKK